MVLKSRAWCAIGCSIYYTPVLTANYNLGDIAMMLTLSSSNARLRGTSNKPGSTKSPISPVSDDGRLNSPGGFSQKSPSSTNLSSKLPPLPASPSLSQSIMTSTGEDILNLYHLPRPLPLWLNPAFAKHIVKGNFMTLSARPKTVEQGEWVAHHGNHISPPLVGFSAADDCC